MAIILVLDSVLGFLSGAEILLMIPPDVCFHWSELIGLSGLVWIPAPFASLSPVVGFETLCLLGRN